MEYTVRSSHGVLTIDEDGYVTECQRDNNESAGGGHLVLITRFDLVEWRRFWSATDQAEIDILDLGYWYNDPKTKTSVYVAPDAGWRKEIAEILLQRKRYDRIRTAAPDLLAALKYAYGILGRIYDGEQVSNEEIGSALQPSDDAITKAEDSTI